MRPNDLPRKKLLRKCVLNDSARDQPLVMSQKAPNRCFIPLSVFLVLKNTLKVQHSIAALAENCKHKVLEILMLCNYYKF